MSYLSIFPSLTATTHMDSFLIFAINLK